MSVVSIRDLSKFYGRRVGIDGVSLEIQAGELFGFLGPNGAGKTTTIGLLMALMRAPRGEARIFGLDYWRDGPRLRQQVGYLPGDLRLSPWLTARRALRLSGQLRGEDVTRFGTELVTRFQVDMVWATASDGNSSRIRRPN
jgi:ABC-2 type transport system ATP-binding protein